MDAITKKAFKGHICSLSEVIKKYRTNQASLIGTVLHAWCFESYPHLSQSSLPVNKKLMSDSRVIAFLNMLKNLPFLDAAYRLSTAYALLSENTYRKSLALYFTPPSLTERLLTDLETQGISFNKGRFFDPACGGAAFIAPIALRMKDALKAQGASPSKILIHIEKNLYGMDVDIALCALSEQFLKIALYSEIKTVKREPSFRILTGNSLCDLEDFNNTVDVLICNPPYRKINKNDINNYRTPFKEVIEGQPNMYGLFIALSIKLLKPNGLCSLVTPTSFLSGRYFSKLRDFIMKESHILNIGIVSDRSGVFIDVLQETALTLLKRIKRVHLSDIKARVSLVSRDGNCVDVGNCMLPNSGAAWPIPRIESDVILLKKSAESEFRIRDYGYEIRIGSFVWNRDKRPVFMSAKELSRKNIKTAVPLLWSSDIKNMGILKFDGTEKKNGEPCFVDYGDKSHCSIIRRNSVILQRVTSNDQPRRLIASVVSNEFIKKYGGFVGENHTVILEKIVTKPVLTANKMAKLLNGYMADRYFRSISGATNVSVFELKQLPLPDPGLLKHHLDNNKSMDIASILAVFGNSEIPVEIQNELRT